MQNGFSLRAVVDICGIPLTTLRNYRKRGIISPDVADKSGKFTLYSDAQIEIAKAYRSEHPPKNDKNQDASADDTTFVASNTAGKKAYLVNPPNSLGVKFNCLNIYLHDNGSFEVDAHFDTTKFPLLTGGTISRPLRNSFKTSTAGKTKSANKYFLRKTTIVSASTSTKTPFTSSASSTNTRP